MEARSLKPLAACAGVCDHRKAADAFESANSAPLQRCTQQRAETSPAWTARPPDPLLRGASMSAMATIKINVKWGKENVPCEIKPGQTPDQLFDDLQSKTGVPVARQKLMARGAWRGVLKSGMAMDLKDGQNVTLMGTADVLLKPKVETKFLEDMKVGKQRRKRPST